MRQKTVSEIVEKVVRSQFSSDFIQSVSVDRQKGNDGEPSFKVTVIVNGQFTKADQQKMLGLVRHIRSELSEDHWKEFPVVDFMSRADAMKMGLEAA